MTEPRPLLAPANVERARKALAEHALCDHCLGRLFGKVDTGLRNDERGRMLRHALGAAQTEIARCFVCEGLFSELDAFAELVLEAFAPYEFDTYLVGSRVDADVEAREAEARLAAGVDADFEAVNTEINREVGRRVGDRLGKKVDFRDPQITAIVDTRFDHVELSHGGLFVYGRYRKFDRTLPQTIWPCYACRQRGCKACNGTGKRYPTSVQELLQEKVLEATGGTEAAFHGAGREDVDARCLGTGRPFVLEIKDPRRRRLDYAALEAAVNAHARPRAEAEGLRLAEKSEVMRVKDFRGVKTYLAHVKFERPVSGANLFKAIQALRGAAIAQRTPQRVEHRRADKVRDRRVVAIEVEAQGDDSALLRITGDAGLYIKELVSGDEGRTRPSLAELVGVPARVQELDIVAVEYDETEGGALQPVAKNGGA